jgi:hypothetical protein
MGRATEELADRAGPGIGGLLNVTFGNFPELLIAFFALREGLHEVVKASIIGSVLGNVLLVLGGSMLVGGLGRERQQFNRRAAKSQATMLMLASAALVMPAVFELPSCLHRRCEERQYSAAAPGGVPLTQPQGARRRPAPPEPTRLRLTAQGRPRARQGTSDGVSAAYGGPHIVGAAGERHACRGGVARGFVEKLLVRWGQGLGWGEIANKDVWVPGLHFVSDPRDGIQLLEVASPALGRSALASALFQTSGP